MNFQTARNTAGRIGSVSRWPEKKKKLNENRDIKIIIVLLLPVAVTARSKAWVFGPRLLGLRLRISVGHGCLSLVNVECSQA